jgi:uncharacterized protein (TIGR02996 family)
MTNEEAFVQEIAQHPDDDTPRLIYADWLEERGDPRGEFIRVQVALARAVVDDPRRPELELREKELLQQHRAEWLGPLAMHRGRCVFQRGFLEQVIFHSPSAPQDCLALVPALALCPTIQHLTLRCAGGRVEYSVRAAPSFSRPSMDVREARALAELPFLSQLRTLDLVQQAIDHDGLRVLAASPHLTRLTTLNLEGNFLGREGVRSLLLSPLASRLESLDLTGPQARHFPQLFNIDDYGVELLVASFLHLSRLEALIVKSNPLGPDAAVSLGYSPHLRGLKLLNLACCRLGDAGGRGLAKGRGLVGLEKLYLKGNGIRADGARALAGSPLAARLKHLDLRDTRPLEDAGAVLLAASSRLAGQTILDLRQQRIGPDGARALAESTHLATLTALDLSGNPLENDGARFLASSPYLKRLTRLSLASCRIGDAGAEALADSPHLSGLTDLDLHDNVLDVGGAEALAGSPYLCRLETLYLHGNEIRAAGAEALAESAFLDSLIRLHIDGDRIGVSGRRALMERYGDAACHF